MMDFGIFVMGVGAVIMVVAMMRDDNAPAPESPTETPREDIIA